VSSNQRNMPELINLDGQYKVDVYNQQDELLESSDFFSNFITQTGLSYPWVMPFGDTFKWLSIGSDNSPNTINTTGLGSWFDGKDYKEDYTDAFSYMTGFQEDGCGYVENLSGVDLYRAWRVPEKKGRYMRKAITFKELMVAPGRFKKETPKDDDSDYLWTGIGKGSAGPETHTSGLSAFSRVVREQTIPSGDYAVITYKLGITVNHLVQDVNRFIGLYEANHTNKNGTPYSSPMLWEGLTGQARVLHAGVQVIKGAVGEGEEGGGAGGDGDAKIGPGDTYRAECGDPMEPFESGETFQAYFSTDNTQWLLDPYLGGKVCTGAFIPWNKTSGCEIATGFPEFFHDIYSTVEKPDEEGGGAGGGGEEDKCQYSLKGLQTDKNRFDRWTKYRTEKSLIPTPEDYTKELEGGKLTSAGYSWNSTILTSDCHETTVFEGTEDFSVRTRNSTRVSSWQAKNAQQDSVPPYNWITYRSLVFGQSLKAGEGSDAKFVPFFDSLFGTYGTADEFLPTFSILDPPDINYTFTGTTGYYPFQDGNNGMNITWNLVWSAPCGEVTQGCTNP
jgi:hypothetical protein